MTADNYGWFASEPSGTPSDMKTLRRKKTRRQRATALLGDYLKVKTAQKAAKGATRAAKGTAVVKASQGAAKRTPIKPLAIAGAIGAAGLIAARRRGGGSPATA
jgi:hypothetical protein